MRFIKILKRIGAFLGTILVLTALAAPQLVGVVIFLPPAAIAAIIGFLVRGYTSKKNYYWLPYGAAASGCVGAGTWLVFTSSEPNVLGGAVMSFLYALLIPAGMGLGWYALTGKRPQIMQLFADDKSDPRDV